MTLADKIEAAEVGSRELDLEIHNFGHPPSLHYVLSNMVPHYTTSIDAAMTLLPEDAQWFFDSHYNMATIFCYWPPNHADDDGYESFNGEGSSPALALCAAALRAKAQADG